MSGTRNTATTPQDELAKLRAELEREHAQLATIEEGVEMKAAQLSYLNAEYIANLSRVRSYYEPKLRPLRAITFAAEEKQKFIDMQIAWLEKKIAFQDKCATENGLFLESRDMKPAAEELMKGARQALLRAYAEIEHCPPDALRTLVNYENPPDAVIETMFMVQRLRGEANLHGPILATEEAAGEGTVADTPPPQPSTTTATATATAALAKEGVGAAKVAPSAAAHTAAAPATASHEEKEEDEEREQMLWAASASWPHATVLVSHNYFTNFFVPRSEGMLNTKAVLEPTLMLALEAFCENPDHTVANLHKCSTPIGCLGQWLHAVRDIYRVRMITAPVLLKAGEHSTPDGIRAIHHTLQRITFGKAGAGESNGGNNPGEQPEATGVAAVADGVKAEEGGTKMAPVLGEASTSAADSSGKGSLIKVDPDLLSKYHATKRRLAELTRPSAVGQDTVYRLRHRLRQLDESCREAREEMARLQAEMDAKVAEVRGSYDDSMLPLHDQLEVQTREFLTVLTGDEAVAR